MAALGIIGGIAPGSTIEYYRLVIERYRRAADGRYPSVLINSIDLSRLLQLAAEHDRTPLVRYLATEVDRLVQAGADFALFASNTPHVVFDEVAGQAAIPLLSIVEAAARAAKARRFERLGLLGTRFTMEGGTYQSVFARTGMTVLLPDDADRTWLHEAYVTELVNGEFREETRRRIHDLIARLRQGAGVDSVILGGTELPLLLRCEDVGGVPLLDTTSIHVDAAVSELLSREGR